MHDGLRSDDARLNTALEAMQRTPDVARHDVALVAARAVIANAPTARATLFTLRAAATLVVVVLGARLLSSRGSARDAMVPGPAVVDAMPTAASSVIKVARTGARPIVFELDAADAQSVQVLGDFNGWSREASGMQRGADGRWRLTTLLPPGRYVYAYLIDGERFVRDPARDAIEDRDFGVTGSELVVSEAP